MHESNCKVMHCSAWKGYIEMDLFMQVICLAIFNHILHSIICMICNFQVTLNRLYSYFLGKIFQKTMVFIPFKFVKNKIKFLTHWLMEILKNNKISKPT